MADLYRKSSLERISNPEQLDKVIKVTSPMSWLALIAIALIVAVAVVWSVIGTIPVTITVGGVISAPVGSNAVYSEEIGTVVSVRVREGDELHLGDEILSYKTVGNEIKTIYSDQVGYVSSVLVRNGDPVAPSNEVIRVIPSVQGSQIVVCYVPAAQAKKLERGMLVNVNLNYLDSSSYGNMAARIVNIDAYAVSMEGMNGVLGASNNLSASFTQNGAVVAVACELYPDENTLSGYYWSNEKGANVEVANGSQVTAKIVTEEVAPITKLFAKLDELWGN